MTPPALHSDRQASYDASAFPPFAVTVDLVALTIVDGSLQVLLVERGGDPFTNRLALPGGFVRPTEDLETAARRELAEETSIAVTFLEQLRTYGRPDRDPRMRVVSVAYLCFAPIVATPVGGSDALRALVMPVQEALSTEQLLAFDHDQILREGVERARSKLEYTTLAPRFCSPLFTMAELRQVYEATWGVELEPANFRRKVLSCDGFVRPTKQRRPPGSDGGKPAELFCTGIASSLQPPLYRPSHD